MRYHNRLGISADLRRALGLHQITEGDTGPTTIVEVGIADIEAKQIKLTWADERNGRLVMDDDGKVTKLSVFGVDGRDWETTKSLFDRPQRIEEVVEKLRHSSTS
jgi:central kinetochore subunit Mal2/MCM21